MRYDAAQRPLEELHLVCLDAADALLAGGRLGWRVEVWDGPRVLGVVGDGAVSPPPAPANSDAAAPSPWPMAAPSPAASAPAAPQAEPQAPLQDGPRAYNPFRRSAWRRTAP